MNEVMYLCTSNAVVAFSWAWWFNFTSQIVAFYIWERKYSSEHELFGNSFLCFSLFIITNLFLKIKVRSFLSLKDWRSIHPTAEVWVITKCLAWQRAGHDGQPVPHCWVSGTCWEHMAKAVSPRDGSSAQGASGLWSGPAGQPGGAEPHWGASGCPQGHQAKLEFSWSSAALPGGKSAFLKQWLHLGLKFRDKKWQTGGISVLHAIAGSHSNRQHCDSVSQEQVKG